MGGKVWFRVLTIAVVLSCFVPVLAAIVAGVTTALPHASAATGGSRSASGYWLVASDGGVFAYGDAAFYGSTGGVGLNKPVVATAATPDGRGYWLVASDGGVFAYGDAAFYGSTGGVGLNKPVVATAATPDGRGYWLVASDGGVFAYGDAAFYGSTGGVGLNKPVVATAATPDGRGYWLVASDGGVFAYGDAAFYGSTGGVGLNKPVVATAATPDGRGYWLVASDGGVFAYGDAAFYGSTGGVGLNKPVVATAATPDGRGYWLVASDGGVFAYGDAAFYGSTGGVGLNKPVVATAAPLTTTTAPSGGMPAPAGYTAQRLILDDQFSGTTLDTKNWVTYLGSSGVVWNNKGNLPLPYSGPTSVANGGTGYVQSMYGPSQVSVDNGLTLTAQPNTNQWASTYPWISGIVTTEGKFTLPSTGWYVQAKIKMPDMSHGMWPALWFLPPVGGTPFNEIDGFEGGMYGNIGPMNESGSSNYFPTVGSQTGANWGTPGGVDISAGYHTYGVRYIPGVSITTYFDGHQVWQTLESTATITPEPYDIMLELEVASQKAGFHTPTTANTPTSSMEVAEVQAYS